MIISLENQIAAMAHRWPHFRVEARDARNVLWKGPLAPDKREHTVQIVYRVPLAIENGTAFSLQPRVEVLHPRLERHADYEEGPIPHVYWRKKGGEPFLCLFDPARNEWGVDDLIADTTVYWAAEWLFFYEGWLLTSRWRGGGTHPVAKMDG